MRIVPFIALIACLLMPSYGLAGPGGAKPKFPVQVESSVMPLPPGSMLLSANTIAADAMQEIMATRVSKESPILVASMVSLDDFNKTSSFGRLAMQQVGSRLGQYGYRIVDSRLRRNLAIRNQEGEFMLTRDTARLLQTEYDAQAVLVGSYVNTTGTVFCSLRLIRLDDGAVVAAYEYPLANKGEVRRLLRMKDYEVRQEADAVWSKFADRQKVASAGDGAIVPKVTELAPGPVVVTPSPRSAEPLVPPQQLDNFPVLSDPQDVFR